MQITKCEMNVKQYVAPMTDDIFLKIPIPTESSKFRIQYW